MKKHRNYAFTSKSVNYSVLGTIKEALGHDDLQGYRWRWVCCVVSVLWWADRLKVWRIDKNRLKYRYTVYRRASNACNTSPKIPVCRCTDTWRKEGRIHRGGDEEYMKEGMKDIWRRLWRIYEGEDEGYMKEGMKDIWRRGWRSVYGLF